MADIPKAFVPDRRNGTVLVTGAEGFVGGHLVPALRADGYRVVAASRQQIAGPDRVRLDLTDPAAVRSVLRDVRPTRIVHLAAQASVARGIADTARTWEVNLGGTLSLATAVGELCPQALFLFASSAEVYGRTFNQGVVTEASPLDPQSAYARSKAAAEAMLRDVLPPSCGLVIARPGNHSGAGQSIDFAIPTFAEQIARAERLDAGDVLVGNLEAKRDFLHVDDVTDAYRLLVAKGFDLPRGSVVNISSEITYRIGDLLDRLLALATRPMTAAVEPSRMRPNEIPVAAIDAALLRTLGWRPTRTIDAMLAAVLDERRLILSGG